MEVTGALSLRRGVDPITRMSSRHSAASAMVSPRNPVNAGWLPSGEILAVVYRAGRTKPFGGWFGCAERVHQARNQPGAAKYFNAVSCCSLSSGTRSRRRHGDGA
jgi:hypothetical protein